MSRRTTPRPPLSRPLSLLAASLLSTACSQLPVPAAVTAPIAAVEVSASPAPKAEALLPREERVPGGLALVNLPPELPADTAAFLGAQRVWIMDSPQGRVAALGLPLGEAQELRLSLRQGEHELATLPIALSPKARAEQRLTIKNTQQVNPGPDELARYQREAAEQQAVYKAFNAKNQGWPRFIKPTAGHYSSPFGLQRFFNGEPRAPHSGIDIAAPTGQAIVAPADGVVAQTGDYFFNGQTVLIDHGNGLVSMLCHMSKILVAKGQVLKAGDSIGLVGATGRATGPHLHWSVSLNDARIDPLLVLPEAEPATPQ